MGARRYVLVMLAATLALPPGASARSSAAIDVVLQAAGAAGCDAALDVAGASAIPTRWDFVTPQRPAGFDVTLRGTAPDPSSAFTSQWLVTGGRAFPQNVPAARLATGCAPVDQAPRTALDWHRSVYLDPSTGELNAWSNTLWSNGRQVHPFDSEANNRALGLEESMAVWARPCRARKQTVRFARTLYLLGPPSGLRFSVSGLVRGLRTWPFTSMTLRIGGVVVGRRTTPGSLDVDVPASVLRTIDYGPNLFEATVVKRRTGSCNGRAPRKLGVFLGVVGRQAWTVRISRPPSGQTMLPLVPFTMTNDGPSVLLEPRFEFSLAYDQLVETIPPGVAGDPHCLTHPPNEAVVCGFDPLGPGESTSFNVGFLGRPAPPFVPGTPFRVRFTESWEGSFNPGGIQNGQLCVGLTQAQCDAP